MKEAADILAESPYALQLRYLQTLSNVATEQNSTIVFPLPVDLLSFFEKYQSKIAKTTTNSFVFTPVNSRDHNDNRNGNFASTDI